jgi:hypothetical protein
MNLFNPSYSYKFVQLIISAFQAYISVKFGNGRCPLLHNLGLSGQFFETKLKLKC